MSAVLKQKRRAAARRKAPAKPSAPPRQRTASAEPPLHERTYWQIGLRSRLHNEPADTPTPDVSRLIQLAEMFGFSPFETDCVAALWTSAHSAEWRAELAARDVFPGHVTVAGLARSFGHASRVRLASESPLRLWRIVAEHPFVEGTAALSLDPHIIAWLDGEHELDRSLIGHVRLLPSSFELPSWQLDEQAGRIRAGLQANERWRIRLCGGDFASAHACAAALAGRLGVLALCVHAETSPSEEARDRAVRVQRQAFLDRCAPCWSARDAPFAWPEDVAPFPVQFVVGSDALPADARLRDIDIVLPEPDASERRALWLSAIPAAAAWPADALDDLALRFDASPGEILRAAATEPRNADEAAARIRVATLDDLDGLARRLACPFTWDDLVVPAGVRERLEDVAFEARERARLWALPDAARQYPQGRGLVALLAGPPGTGKTMSAQVIAAELGLDLLRVDISRILSKWVGETAQHLQRVLSSPSSRRAVLLFDEADALFGKRIEDARQAQDHFVNMDLSHLMVALESYTGVVLLATNLRANVDAAFVRRIRHSIDFAMPDLAAREAIWLRAMQALFGPRLSDQTRDAVTRVARVEASGAQIKNAALSATFTSRRLRCAPDAALLGRMLARELAKDGAGLSSRELATTLGIAQ